MAETIREKDWTLVIRPKSGIFDLKLNEIWAYRDLLALFVKRDITTFYKQTVLGPLWFFIQPILTTVTFTIIFGNIAQIPTDGIPKMLFYLSGITVWNYFAGCLTRTSGTFISNAQLFGKVYFPRMIVPLSNVLSNLVKFGIQFLLFLAFWMYFRMKGSEIEANIYLLLLPVLIIIISGLGLGFGIVISALTTKYRDLQHLVAFGVQLMMYATPIVYPLSTVSDKYKWILLANPMTGIIETFKYGFLGTGVFSWWHLAYSFIFMMVMLIAGSLIFNKVEKNFIDTV